MSPVEFIEKWGPGGPAYGLNEEQGAQSHFLDLCELLEVPKPGSREDYIFEKQSLVLGAARGYADVFFKDRFAWENKAPGKNLDSALKQLLTYSLALSNPPLLIVCDRLIIRVHTQFNGHPSDTYIVRLDELNQPEKRELLKRVWTNPESFRPAQTNKAITESAAHSFATLAAQLRSRGNSPEKVAHFLTQCLFCFFAEDVKLLPGRMFERLVGNTQISCARLTEGLSNLFATMRDGGLYGPDDIPWFNGGLFQTVDVPDLNVADITELRNASSLNWSAIDVSIFGTLFERGLDPAKRSQLGAHYTDPATIERLIDPVIRRPLLKEWEKACEEIRSSLTKFSKKGDRYYRAAHSRYIHWLERLSAFRVLDPACGSGNFLFLALKALKNIEHQSQLDAVQMGLEREQDLVTGPQNLLGIEINEYAAELARVTVWIGELQWRIEHGYSFKTNPVLEPLDHIECRDAILEYPPDDQELTVCSAIETQWPDADVIVGNPPFLGGKKFVSELGEETAADLRNVFMGRVPGLADLACYWFEKSKNQILNGKLNAFGLVATNSIHDGFGREVLKRVADSTPIFEAWRDVPWVNEGASVQVSLIAFSKDDGRERRIDGRAVASIGHDLREVSTILPDLTRAKPLEGNKKVAFQGTTRSGPFDIPGDLAREWLMLPNPQGRRNSDVIRPWRNGLDIMRRPSDTWIVDFGIDMTFEEACLYEAPFRQCDRYVKPTRLQNRNQRLVEKFWHYDGVRVGMRNAIRKLDRYIAVVVTAKYRVFVWLHHTILPDATLVAIAREDDTTFGILQSRMHQIWSTSMGTTLEDRPRYTPTTSFETFPFPEGLSPSETADQLTEPVASGALIPSGLDPVIKGRAESIANAAKKLSDDREEWLNPPDWTKLVSDIIPLGMIKSPYPDRIEPELGYERMVAKRTMTNLYNDPPIWLQRAHQDLDEAVAHAYGWTDYTPGMPDNEILRRLLALNLTA